MHVRRADDERKTVNVRARDERGASQGREHEDKRCDAAAAHEPHVTLALTRLQNGRITELQERKAVDPSRLPFLQSYHSAILQSS